MKNRDDEFDMLIKTAFEDMAALRGGKMDRLNALAGARQIAVTTSGLNSEQRYWQMKENKFNRKGKKK